MSGNSSSGGTGNNRSGLVLTALQHRLITTALASLSLFVICVLLFILFKVLTVFVAEFSTVLLPLAIAGVLAGLLRPVASLIEVRTRLDRLGSTIALYALTMLVLTFCLWLFLPVIVSQSIQFFHSLPAIYQSLHDIIGTRFPQLVTLLTETFGEDTLANLGDQAKTQLAENVRGLLVTTASLGHQYFVSLFGIAAATAIIPVYLFFFLKSETVNKTAVETHLSWVRKDVREDILFLAKNFLESLETFFQGQILIGLIMGAMLATGFSIAGITFGFFLGICIGLLNIIPYLGTIIGLGTILPIAYLQPEGGLLTAAIGLGVFIVVQIIEGYILTPRIMGNRTGLHPLTIIIAIFFWGTALDGLIGMILAIPLTAFFVVAWRLLREKYLKAWMGNSAASEG
jgi:predicted PurR-regulated permease PerM